MNFMLDTNIYDEVLKDEQTYQKLLRLSHGDLVKLFITSVQLNEINAIQDIKYKNRIIQILEGLSLKKLSVELAPYGYAYGDCYGGISPEATLDTDKFMTSKKHVHDAMIFATASSSKHKIDVVVTEDVKFRAKVKAQGLTTSTMNYEKFKSHISSPAHSKVIYGPKGPLYYAVMSKTES